MSDDSNVVHFTTIKVTRDATADLEETVRRSCRESVEQIAILHGGKPDEWIQAKAATMAGVMMDLVGFVLKPVQLALPKRLHDDTVAEIEATVAAWAREHHEQCQRALVNQMVELLRP